MGYIEKHTITCEKCGKVFDIDVPRIIDSKDVDLKKKLFDGQLQRYVCPHCKEDNFQHYPFKYVDEDLDFEVYGNSLAWAVAYYEDFKDDILDSGKRVVCATSNSNVCSKIVMLENGLDYRIATIYQLLVEKKVRNLMEKQDKKAKFVESYVEIDEDGDVAIFVCFDNMETKVVKLDKDLYNKIKEKDLKDLDNMWTFAFDQETAIAYLKKKEEKWVRDERDVVDVALVDLGDGIVDFAEIPQFKVGEFNEDDEVCVMLHGDITNAKVVRTFRMCSYDIPFDFDCPTIAYKIQNVEVITSNDSNAELYNEDYIETVLKPYAFEDKDLDPTVLAKKDVIIGLENLKDASGVFELVETKEIKKGTKLCLNDIKDRIHFGFMDNKPFVKVYLNQIDFDNEHASRVVLKFDDLIRLVVNAPDLYSGVGIVLDKDDKKANIFFDQKQITDYRKNSFMLDGERMKDLMLKMTDKEKEYLQKMSYDCIYKVYVEGKNVQQIMEELNINKEEIDSALGYGYGRLKHIVWDNYMEGIC